MNYPHVPVREEDSDKGHRVNANAINYLLGLIDTGAVVPTDHGSLTGLTDYDHLWALNKDITTNVTVGYTTDIEAVTIASGTLTPVLTLEHFKTLAVSGSFTLAVPSPTGGNGHCAYRVTVTGGPWTITKGANVESVGTLSTLVSGTKYVLNVYKFSDTDCIVQLNSTA